MHVPLKGKVETQMEGRRDKKAKFKSFPLDFRVSMTKVEAKIFSCNSLPVHFVMSATTKSFYTFLYQTEMSLKYIFSLACTEITQFFG